MNRFERQIRTWVIQTLRETSTAPSVADLALTFKVAEAQARQALQALADEHRLVLWPGTDRVWMAHPFSAVATDFLVHIGSRAWYANCAWDGLSILSLLGDGVLETHSPATGEALAYAVRGGHVDGDGIVHFLVPARSFWDDIGFT